MGSDPLVDVDRCYVCYNLYTFFSATRSFSKYLSTLTCYSLSDFDNC